MPSARLIVSSTALRLAKNNVSGCASGSRLMKKTARMVKKLTSDVSMPEKNHMLNDQWNASGRATSGPTQRPSRHNRMPSAIKTA